MFGVIAKWAVGSLFGGSNTAKEAGNVAVAAAQEIGEWVDERNFTPEEKAKADLQTLQTTLKGVELTRDENSTRSVTRRYLAWAIMGSYLFAFLLTITVGYFVKDFADHVLRAIEVFQIGHLALAVGSFYFIASLTRSIRKS